MKPARATRGTAIAVAATLLAAGATAVGLATAAPAGPAARAAPAAARAAGASPAAATAPVARDGTRGRTFPELVAARAPAGWHHATLPNGKAELFYPPGMHRVSGDSDSVSAARLGPAGKFLLYLNATPRQGQESLRNWASYRVRVLRSDDASRASLDTAAEGQQFRGGTGSCVIDHYVTRIGGHRYTELACLVKGRTGASVIVAAAPTARRSLAEPILERAVSAYLVR
jgi:hypothetical protein